MRLRTRLMSVLAVALIPALLVFAWFAVSQWKSSESRLHEQQAAAVRLRGQVIDQILDDLRVELEQLALTSEVRRAQWNDAQVSLSRAATLRPRYRFLGIADASGTVLASSTGKINVNVSDREWFARVLSTREYAVGTYEQGLLAGGGSLPIAVPLRDASGRHTGVVFAEYSLSDFQARLAEIPEVPGSVMSVFDRVGHVLANAPPSPAVSAGDITGTHVVRVASSSGAGRVMPGPDGTVRRYDTHVVRFDGDSPLVVALGHDESTIAHPQGRQVLLTLVLLGSIGIGQLSLGYVALRSWVLVPVRRLDDAARSMKDGDLSARVGELSSSEEFAHLGERFDSMAHSIQASADEQRTRQNRIEALHGVMEAAVSTVDLDASAQRILDYLVSRHGFDLASAWIGRGSRLLLAASSGFPDSYAERVSPMRLTADHDVPKVFETGLPVIVPDTSLAEESEREFVQEQGLDVGAYIVLPLSSRGQIIGVITFGWREPRSMSAADVEFYESLCSEVGVVLENARLYETEREVADRLREALLSLPEAVQGIDFAHGYHSAAQALRVGGDFYDLFALSHHHVGIIVGDVAGKGIDAAVMTSMVKNTMRAHAHERGKTPSRVAELTNDVVYKATRSDSFVTVFFGILDCRDGRLVYVNGGHTTGALVRADGEVEKLPSTGPIVGGFERACFDNAETRMGLGDVLFLYTDGLTEARRDKEMYGERRLLDLLGRLGGSTPDAFVKAATADVLSYTGTRLSDDLAILAVTCVDPEPLTVVQQKLDV